MRVIKIVLSTKSNFECFLHWMIGGSVLAVVLGLLCKFSETVAQTLAPLVPHSSGMLDFGAVGIVACTVGLLAEEKTSPSFSEVEQAIRRFESESGSPVSYQIIRYTLVAFIMFAVAWMIGVLQFAEVALLTSLVAVVRYVSSDRPDTWKEYINDLLLSYEPVDRPAFILLQQATRQNRSLTASGFNTWVAAESAARSRKRPLDKYKATHKRPVKLSFVNRDV